MGISHRVAKVDQAHRDVIPGQCISFTVTRHVSRSEVKGSFDANKDVQLFYYLFDTEFIMSAMGPPQFRPISYVNLLYGEVKSINNFSVIAARKRRIIGAFTVKIAI
ncbi:hypothetical protein GEV33_014776 [Tenebrio molitor]|uniref:Uncharacterized protein n=1 Tax=Tenebrio molitor TaxID=7067 RepID=A0A8J6L6H4_TENMO|nr:hypothetical protein GEV33_014777 [Tenebrio molitor]KAH0808016.1 hypothetical protein GEV33_014776 [Tenebrio molitor]